jgi:hypothetical protein
LGNIETNSKNLLRPSAIVVESTASPFNFKIPSVYVKAEAPVLICRWALCRH